MAGGLNTSTIGGGGPAGAAAGLLFGNPGYNSAPVDSGTQGLVQQQTNLANQSTGQIAQNELNGTNQSGVDTSQNVRQQAAMGGYQDPAMGAALNARSQRIFGSDLNTLQRQAAINAPVQQAQFGNAAFGYQNQMQNLNNANNMAQRQAYQNNQQTRNSIIATVFGAAGSIAGMRGGGANTTMPDGSVAGPGNNFGAGNYSQPVMGDQFSGGAPTLSGTPSGQSSYTLGNYNFGDGD